MEEKELFKKEVKRSFLSVFVLVLFFWFIKAGELVFDVHLTRFGLYPLRASGLLGIFSYPFLHKDLEHLWSNSLPMLVLGTALFFFYKKIALEIFIWIWAVSGVYIWLFAHPGYHIGASGLVYGLAFFLFFSGVFRKNRPQLAIAAIVVVSYGSIVWGLFPIIPNMSWEGHASGALIGTILAYYFARKDEYVAYYQHINVTTTLDKKDPYGDEIKVFYEYKENKKD